MIKRIHVNQHIIKANRNKPYEEHEAPLTVKTSKSNIKAFSVTWDGPALLTYSPEHPLSCGARVWIETTAPVKAETANVVFGDSELVELS